VITGTDKDGGKIKRVGNNAGVRVSDTVKNGAGITTRERVVGESRTVITSEPEIASVRVAKEYKIREAIGAEWSMQPGGFNGIECEVAIPNDEPSLRGRIPAKRAEHAPELLLGGYQGPKVHIRQ
jgi:hypothetical protein